MDVKMEDLWTHPDQQQLPPPMYDAFDVDLALVPCDIPTAFAPGPSPMAVPPMGLDFNQFGDSQFAQGNNMFALPILVGDDAAGDANSATSNHTAGTAPRGKKKLKRDLANEQDRLLIARDDSELTPEELALKRKAQNRQAQRAFRERKETRLKELEAKLVQLEEERQRLMDQLECMRAHNMNIQLENQQLKANVLPSSTLPDSQQSLPTTNTLNVSAFEFPLSQDQFFRGLLDGTSHEIKADHVNRVYTLPDLEDKLLAIGAVWDYLLARLEEAGIELETEDIQLIMNRLRGQEKCHGFGPAYSMSVVNAAFEAGITHG